MNRKQKKLKRQRATHHKLRCKHLKGGDPREWRDSRERLWYKLRASRKKLHRLSLNMIQRCVDKYNESVESVKSEDYIEL